MNVCLVCQLAKMGFFFSWNLPVVGKGWWTPSENRSFYIISCWSLSRTIIIMPKETVRKLFYFFFLAFIVWSRISWGMRLRAADSFYLGSNEKKMAHWKDTAVTELFISTKHALTMLMLRGFTTRFMHWVKTWKMNFVNF